MDLDTHDPIPTGHGQLDALLGGGLHRGHLTAVTGPVAVGKTMFTLGIARHATIRDKRPALFASVETDHQQLTEYVMCAEGRIRFGSSRPGRGTADEIERAHQLVPVITGAPLRFENVCGWTLRQVHDCAIRGAREWGMQLLVVDYVQLLTEAGPEQSWTDHIEAVAVGLKRLARIANIAVVAVTTMRSHAAKAHGLLHPAMFDLGDSEAFERAADELIILHREDQDDRESSRAGEADVIVAKNRGGLTGTVTVAFQPHFARFVDMARS